MSDNKEYYSSLFLRLKSKPVRLAKQAGVQEGLFRASLPTDVDDFVSGMEANRWGECSAGSKGAVGSKFNSCVTDAFGVVLVNNILVEFNQQYVVGEVQTIVAGLSDGIVGRGTTLDYIAWKLSTQKTRVMNKETGDYLLFHIEFGDTDDYEQAVQWMVLAKEADIWALVQVWDREAGNAETPFHVMVLRGVRDGTLQAQDVSRDHRIKPIKPEDFYSAVLVSPIAIEEEGRPTPQPDARYDEIMCQLLTEAAARKMSAQLAGECPKCNGAGRTGLVFKATCVDCKGTGKNLALEAMLFEVAKHMEVPDLSFLGVTPAELVVGRSKAQPILGLSQAGRQEYLWDHLDDVQSLRLLCALGVDLEERRSRKGYNAAHTPFLEAADRYPDSVPVLIAAGANVNALDDEGFSALTLVLYRDPTKSLELTRMLIEARADVNLGRYGGMTPLERGAYYGKAECVRLLLEAGADVGDALSLARDEGETECVKVLEDALAAA